MELDPIAKVSYSLYVSKGHFENLKELDVKEDFIVCYEDPKNIRISLMDKVLSAYPIILPLKEVEKEGDSSYFSDITTWCRKLSDEWEKLYPSDNDEEQDKS